MRGAYKQQHSDLCLSCSKYRAYTNEVNKNVKLF